MSYRTSLFYFTLFIVCSAEGCVDRKLNRKLASKVDPSVRKSISFSLDSLPLVKQKGCILTHSIWKWTAILHTGYSSPSPEITLCDWIVVSLSPPGCVSVSGEAEGSLAVSVCWGPQTQWQTAGGKGRDSPTDQLWSKCTAGQGQTEYSGEPAVSLAKVRDIIHSTVQNCITY